jgi:hypothetical protein
MRPLNSRSPGALAGAHGAVASQAQDEAEASAHAGAVQARALVAGVDRLEVYRRLNLDHVLDDGLVAPARRFGPRVLFELWEDRPRAPNCRHTEARLTWRPR